MKRLTLALALMMPLATHAITQSSPVADAPVVSNDAEPTVMDVVNKLNDIGTDVAICQGYYTYREDTAGILRFAQHGEFMMRVAEDFLTDVGIAVDGNVADVYYRNVNHAADGMGDLDEAALTAMGKECARLDKHIEASKELL